MAAMEGLSVDCSKRFFAAYAALRGFSDGFWRNRNDSETKTPEIPRWPNPFTASNIKRK
jgi:hypothetical protein